VEYLEDILTYGFYVFCATKHRAEESNKIRTERM
jgi:hypothetical protein